MKISGGRRQQQDFECDIQTSELALGWPRLAD